MLVYKLRHHRRPPSSKYRILPMLSAADHWHNGQAHAYARACMDGSGHSRARADKIYSYGLYGRTKYIAMAYTAMAYIVMACTHGSGHSQVRADKKARTRGRTRGCLHAHGRAPTRTYERKYARDLRTAELYQTTDSLYLGYTYVIYLGHIQVICRS